MSTNYVNRSNDEEIIDIVRSVLDNGVGQAETVNECLLIKLMQLRGTPITNMRFDQSRCDKLYQNWVSESGTSQAKELGTTPNSASHAICPACGHEFKEYINRFKCRGCHQEIFKRQA